MSKRKPFAVAATIVSAAALAVPAQSQAAIDLGDTCAALIGDRQGTIDLSPLVRVDYKTCRLADLDG